MQYFNMDGISLSEEIIKGNLRPVELLDSVIDQIEILNPRLNAVIYKNYESARAYAADLESRLIHRNHHSPVPGPFFGIPFLIKNLIADCRGMPFSDGSRFVEGYISPLDAELIKRYKMGGLIILGRTNASEFGVLPTTEPALFKSTKNPWNTDFSPGGSSGGSAAAVASGMVPASHGNDGGGSLRIPASCCGLFALKPSRGRNPLGPLFGDFAGGIVCEHVLTRSVRDSAALLDMTHGPETGDPYFAPPFSGGYLAEIRKPPGRLKIGFLSEVPGGWNPDTRLHPDCRAAVLDAASLCRDLGHTVEEVAASKLEFPDLPMIFINVFKSFVGHAVGYWEKKLGKKVTETDLEPATWDLYQSSMELTGGEYLAAIESLQIFTRKMAGWYEEEGWDLLLSPTMQIPSARLGAFDVNPENPEAWVSNALSVVAFTRTQNITGQPACSIPLYWNRDGLPVGVQFAGIVGKEDLLFRLAAQLESARPWFHHTPPVFAEKELS